MISSEKEDCVNDGGICSAALRRLNDAFRSTFTGGQVLLSRGIEQLGTTAVSAILNAVRTFDAFYDDSDPWEEHDLGPIDVSGHRILWKIDYYDRELELGSTNPADPAVTTRVLTIMLASEY